MCQHAEPLAGVRVGVSYSLAPGEVEGVRAQFWTSACNFGENNNFVCHRYNNEFHDYLTLDKQI